MIKLFIGQTKNEWHGEAQGSPEEHTEASRAQLEGTLTIEALKGNGARLCRATVEIGALKAPSPHLPTICKIVVSKTESSYTPPIVRITPDGANTAYQTAWEQTRTFEAMAAYSRCKTLEEFTAYFIGVVQGSILDCARMTGRRLISCNYNGQILTADFVREWGAALAYGADAKDTQARHFLRGFLIQNWQTLKLHKLSREQLADVVNQTLGTNHTPQALHKIKERAGLWTTRSPGPAPTF
jgi:hypothetical protein